MHNQFNGQARTVVQARDIAIDLHPRDPLREAADELARAVRAQWEDEANVRGLTGPGRMAVPWEARRPPDPTSDPTSDPASDQASDPAPDDHGAGPERLALGDLIAGMPAPGSIRLVITGDGGAGKSSMAVLLALTMLEHRNPGDAVPVILSLPDWDPGRYSLDDWVVKRIREDYGELTTDPEPGLVKALVQARKVVPLLDGLDELMPLPRAEAVTALKRSRASIDAPLVLLSRPEAYQDAAATEPFLRTMPVLRACPVPPKAGRDYLARECGPARLASWRPVFDEMLGNPGGPVATALSSPLMLWLASTVYARDGSRPDDLLDSARLPTRADIEGHLLDGLVPAVFSQGPAPSYVPGAVRAWGKDRALRYLRFLARRPDHGRTQDIAWWQIRTALTRPVLWGAVVLVAVALCGTAASHAAAALLALTGRSPAHHAFGPAEALGAAAGLATVATVVGAITAKHLFPGTAERPRRPVRVTGRLLPALPAVAVALAGAGLTAPGGAPAILTAFLLPVLSDVLLTRPADSATAIKPRLLLDDERRIALAQGAVLAPAVAGLSVAPFRWFDGRPLSTVAALVIAWSCSALALAALSRWGRWTATRLVLAGRRQLPPDVIGFLEDAHRLGVLRQVGGVYQFRHAGLRQRLAGPGPDRPTGAAGVPPEVRMRSSVTSLRALRLLGFDLVMPVLAYLVIISPLSSGTGFRGDWHQTWELLARQRLLLAALVALLLLGALSLRAVATELRIDSELVELNRGRTLRLRWEDVAEVRVRRAAPPRGTGTVLPAQYHLVLKPKPGRGGPKSRTDPRGWVRVWDLGPTELVPLELEVALSRFAGDLWSAVPPSARPDTGSAPDRGRPTEAPEPGAGPG
ncbi:NACHT domain-containing protein [Kitasatospora sp. NPDC003701]